MSDPSSPWWSPEIHADRRPLLLARNRIQSAIRGWLAAQGFTEVDPASLQVSPGNEAHLHGFATAMIGTDAVARPMYLHTSPEFGLKAAGGGRDPDRRLCPCLAQPRAWAAARA